MAVVVRQKTDLACEQCRRRKSKCDRIRPLCGACAGTDTPCVFVNERPKRGPKKGQLNALKAQVASLERRLAERRNVEFAVSHHEDAGPGSLGMDQLDQSVDTTVDMTTGPNSRRVDFLAVSDHPLPNFVDGGIMSPNAINASEPPTPSSASTLDNTILSTMVRADLDALYFERIHPFAPMLHKGRYFSWADQKSPPPIRNSLRFAMWTLAAAVSAQYQSLSDRLYIETRQMLSRLDGNDHDLPWATGEVQLEQTQAWLLLGYYEFIRMKRNHVVATAARAFRLVQRMHLHDVDYFNVSMHMDPRAVSPGLGGLDDTLVVVEEKRRTFWLALCFDRLLSAHDNLSFALHEEVIYLRLPAPEASFQGAQLFQMDFLSDAIANESKSTLSPFAESVVLSTLYGRCLTHRHLVMATALNEEPSYSRDSNEFWRRHDWLTTAIERRMQTFEGFSSSSSNFLEGDPIVIFNHLLSRSAIIHLSDTAAIRPWQTAEQHLMVMTYERRAYQGATEIVHLSALSRLSCFKAHPFLPSALAHTIVFLKRHAEMHSQADWKENGERGVEELLMLLRKFSDVHISARELLEQLDAGVEYVY